MAALHSPPSSFLTLHFLPIPILSPQFLKVFGRNNMGSKAPSWSDQWGNGGLGSDEYEDDVMVKKNNKSNGSGKMADAKAMASVSMGKAKTVAIVGADKAKSAAVVGAQKVKSGTSAGFKWIKNQCQKKKRCLI
ncbi:hypothetical protein KIW84_042996 [Lathyrus oleraceus]|uniref:Uncharacterized protein n=1 Tax=Pisum sativum TaxID=3888 RepID=A0A9D4XEF9_PEA|nr:hypothetical protein KIW84_042996 [Pisum sativum]